MRRGRLESWRSGPVFQPTPCQPQSRSRLPLLHQELVKPVDALIIGACPSQCPPPFPSNGELRINQNHGVEQRTLCLAPFRRSAHQSSKVKICIDKRAADHDQHFSLAEGMVSKIPQTTPMIMLEGLSVDRWHNLPDMARDLVAPWCGNAHWLLHEGRLETREITTDEPINRPVQLEKSDRECITQRGVASGAPANLVAASAEAVTARP